MNIVDIISKRNAITLAMNYKIFEEDAIYFIHHIQKNLSIITINSYKNLHSNI